MALRLLDNVSSLLKDLPLTWSKKKHTKILYCDNGNSLKTGYHEHEGPRLISSYLKFFVPKLQA